MPPLLFPLHRERLHEIRQRQTLRLAAVEDGLDDVQRQQGLAQYTTFALTTLIDETGWRLFTASDINTSGDLVGFGINPSGQKTLE